MAAHRRMLLVAGEPHVIASRAAVRLAHLGDSIEPVSATEFVWRPPVAERRLFRCPRWVRVVVLPAERPGEATVVLDWPRGLGGGWLWALAAALVGLTAWAALTLPPAWPRWQTALLAWPPLAAALAPWLLDSGWQGRLERSCATDGTPTMNQLAERGSWLELDDAARATALAELRAQASVAAAAATVTTAGQDRHSAVEIAGWPLWHVAWGPDPITGLGRRARGWYARGQTAQGLLAVGQKAHGWLAVGQLAVGLVAVGQAAVGVLAAVGQLAVGALLTVGQLAVGLVAVGQFALGLYLTSALPPHSDLSLALIGALLAGSVLFGLAVAVGARLALVGAEQRQLAASVEAQLHGTALVDETSLSRAERLTAEDPDRGLSSVDARRPG